MGVLTDEHRFNRMINFLGSQDQELLLNPLRRLFCTKVKLIRHLHAELTNQRLILACENVPVTVLTRQHQIRQCTADRVSDLSQIEVTVFITNLDAQGGRGA